MMINVVKVLVLSAIAFNASVFAEQGTFDTNEEVTMTEYAAALSNEADLNLSDENADNWWGGWGGFGGWGLGFGIPFFPYLFWPYFGWGGWGGFGGWGCGGWGGGFGGCGGFGGGFGC